MRESSHQWKGKVRAAAPPGNEWAGVKDEKTWGQGAAGGLTDYCWSLGSHRTFLSRGMTCPDLGLKRDSLTGARGEVGSLVYERRHMESDLKEVKCQGLVCEWPYVSWPKKLSQPRGGERKAPPSFPGCMLLRWALSVIKNLPAKTGDTRDVGLISTLGKSPGGGHCNPLQYSCLGNPMDREAWLVTIHGVKD